EINAKIAGDALESLTKAVPQDDVAPDASTSLAQGQYTLDVEENAVTCDIEPEKDESENIAVEDVVNDEDVVVLKSV
ncbi:hypothetical protein A2U01_0099205, partial [Trifolium medium]|nr:hypothetical protein [Trifolium medium]